MRQTAKSGLRTAAAIVALGVAFAPGVSSAQDNTPKNNPSPQQNTAPAQENGPPGQNTPSTQPSGTMDQNGQDVSASSAQTTMHTFTVKKIDQAKGTLTLADSQGDTEVVKAGPDVDLSKLKTGQRLNVTYYAEVAIAITKPGQATSKTTKTQVQRGGVTATQSTVTQKILSVDPQDHTVTVQGPQGKHIVTVSDPTLQSQLGQLKPGDNVQLTYTQAVAIQAEPMQQQQPTQKQPEQQPGTQPPQ